MIGLFAGAFWMLALLKLWRGENLFVSIVTPSLKPYSYSLV